MSSILNRLDNLVLHLLQGLLGGPLQATTVAEDAAHLDGADASEEKVDRSKPAHVSYILYSTVRSGSNVQVVARGDNHAPAGPDGASGHQGTVLREGELLGGAAEVGDTGDDQCPL